VPVGFAHRTATTALRKRMNQIAKTGIYRGHRRHRQDPTPHDH
jgi:hypothetical protein